MLFPPFIEDISKRDPEFYQTVKSLAEQATVPGSLDAKTKTLVLLALDASHGASQGVAVLAKQARELGATEKEIREVLRLAYFVVGNAVLAASAAAYKE